MARTWRWGTSAVVGACIVTAMAVGLGGVVRHWATPPIVSPDGPPATTAPPPSCLAVTPSGRLWLDLGQAANAATIAAVGKRMGLADDAVTVAYVAALQESKLRNLPYGDLDSLGLFQQRPSQGWGAPAQVTDPAYAASAFYSALVRVPHWDAMAVGDAAQAVQRSNGPDAYAFWEHQGRVLAAAFTGEAGAALTCHFDLPASPAAGATSLDDAVAAELGGPAVGVPVAEARGWTVASWLVGHAYVYAISSVTFLGQQWTPSSGRWQLAGPADPAVRVERS